MHALRLLLIAALLAPAAALAVEFSCPQIAGPDELELPEPTDDRLVLSADQAELTQEGLSTLAGTVRLVKGGSRLEAQALSFDRQTQQVKLSAESLFRNRDLIVRSRSAELDLANETGTFHGAEFTLVNRASRGAAETIALARDGTVDVRDVYYTTCPPGSRAWFLQASDIELDRDAGLGRAKHARLRFGYVPILYLPWFQFPIDDRRRSGVLFPTIGDSDTTGFDARLPVYLNLAPNYDAQITPRYMSDRGTMIGTEGRYLFHRNTGHVTYEHLDEDKETRERRTWFDFSHQGLINRRLAAEARYGEVSDTRYFEDFSTSLQAASINYLERSAQLSYTAPAAYSIMARIADYQPVSATALLDPTGTPDPSLEPYQRLPEIRLDAQTRTARLGTRLGLTAQYVNFVRDAPPEGQRLDADPFLRFFVDRSAWYAASQLDYRHTRYSQTDPNVTRTRTLPQFSLEGGLRFERLTDGGELQTLEPRLYYLNVPFRDQATLPQFDSGEPDFDFVQLFERNRYSGIDRISDANHLALSLTSRLLDPADGSQRLSASIGQIYRFEETQVTLLGCTVNCTAASGGTDFIGEVDYRLSAGLRFTTTGQWSQDRNEIVRGGVGLRYRSERRRADLSYRFREELPQFANVELEQIDLSAATPLVGSVSLLGRWRYSREDYRTLEALGGLQYETCCWSLRTAYRRHQFNTDREYTTGVYLQLELKGLTRIGAGFESLLPALD
ncbi:MAG: LPS-assembly protein LptD [Gammaproteobacteria bacterium]